MYSLEDNLLFQLSYEALDFSREQFTYYNKKFRFLKKLKLLFILNSSLMCLGGLLSIILFRYNHYIYFTIFIFFQFLIGMITTFVNVPLISLFQKNVEIEYQSCFFNFIILFRRVNSLRNFICRLSIIIYYCYYNYSIFSF